MFKQYHAVFCLLFAACVACVSGLDFTGSKWIWTPARPASGSYPVGDVAFRREFFAPSGKTPVSANIVMTADDSFTLYVNGLKLGSGEINQPAQRYCVPLVKECNVFAVAGTNGPIGPITAAGLLAAIEIKYLDGSTETIVSDEQWHAVTGLPAGFEQVQFDDSRWLAAFTNSRDNFTVTIPPDNQITPRPLTLESAYWVWTNESTGPTAAVPIGPRAFRKTIMIPNNQVAAQAKFLITADNEYTLYVNGRVVGSGRDFQTAQRYTVNFPPTDRVVIAVFGLNNETGGPAGLIVSAEIVTCDCAENFNLVTNGSWKYSINIPADFIESDYNDSAWPTVFVEGRQGVAPWGNTVVPAANSPQSPPLNGAPPAPPANVVV